MLASVGPARAGAAVNWTELSVNELLPTETVRLVTSARTVQSDLTPVYTTPSLPSRKPRFNKPPTWLVRDGRAAPGSHICAARAGLDTRFR